jgi:hypothetical protein
VPSLPCQQNPQRFFGRCRLLGRPGFSLAEITLVVLLVTLGLLISFQLINQRPLASWYRQTQDLMNHLTSLRQRGILSYGQDPLTVTSPCQSFPCDSSPVFPGGWIDLIQELDNTGQFLPGPPSHFVYAQGVHLYPNPWTLGEADPNHELRLARWETALKQSNTEAGQWLLLDMNGPGHPNSLQDGGDRVLIVVMNDPMGIFTATEICRQFACQIPTGPSFYDQLRDQRRARP